VSTFNDKVRKHTLALELARLDELQEVFYRQAKASNVKSAQKIIERRCVMLWLHAPQTATLQIVEASARRETSTDRIERVLNELLED
jgi:hypothetical protein